MSSVRLSRTPAIDSVDEFDRGLDEPAAGFDVLKVLPRLFGQLFGEVLDEPRSAGRVEHPPDVGFLQQQQLRVAGDAPAKPGAMPGNPFGNRHIERVHQHRVGTADARGERGQRGAQHVHPRIALRHHRQRRDGVHGGGTGVRLAHHFGHPGPQLARGAQLRDRHELVVIGGETEADLPQRIRYGDATFSPSSRR